MKINQLIEKTINRSNTFKMISLLSGDRIIKLFVGLIIQTWLARYLGPEDFGKLQYVSEFVFFFTLVVSFGLDEYYIKEFSRQKKDLKIFFNNALSIRFLISTLSYFLCIVIAWISLGNSDLFFYICFFGFILFLKPLELLEILFQSQLKSKAIFVSRQFGFISSNGLKIIFIFLGFNWFYFVLSNIVEYIVARFLILKKFQKEFFKITITFKIQDFIKSLNWGLPYLLISLYFFLEFRAGIFILNFHSNLREVGILALTINLLVLADFFIQVILNSSLPEILKLYESSKTNYKKRFNLLFRLVFLFPFILFVASIIWGESVIVLIFGKEYQNVSHLLPWGVGLLLISSFNHLRFRWFIIENKTKDWFILHTLAFIISIIFQLYFVPLIGAKASFIGVATGHILATLLTIGRKGVRENFYFFLK